MSDDVESDVGIADATGGISMAAQHASVPERGALNLAATDGGSFNTLRPALAPVACWRLNAPGFAFDSSFVAPAFKDEIATLHKVVAANPGCPAAIFGHCDPAGTDELNKTLGDRRAIAIYALLTRQTAMWADLYDHPQVGDAWGTQALQLMLSSLMDRQGTPYYGGSIDGVYGTGTTAAVKSFQPSAGLTASGQADGVTRKALFAAYMEWLCTPDAPPASPFRMASTDFLGGTDAKEGDLPKMSLQGCSELNPVVLLPASEMSAGGDTSRRNAADAPNRRVVMFFFKAGTTVDPAIWPCPKVKEPLAACRAAFWPDGDARRRNGPALREYKVTRDTMACRFYDRFARRSPCEGSAPAPVPPIVVTRTLRIQLINNDDQPLAGLEYELAVGGRSLSGSTDATGVLKEEIPAGVDSGILMTHLWSLALEIGDLDDDSISGAKARLNNLGLHAGKVLDDSMDDLARRAVQRFKMLNGLAPSDGSAPSGDLDGPTKQKLRERHGS